MKDEPSPLDLLPEIDLAFIHRVYRTSLILLVLGGLLVWARFGAPAALGFLVGGGLSVAVLWTVEWSVRRYIRPESRSARGLVGFSLAKMGGAAILILGTFLAARRGWLSPLWVLLSFPLPFIVAALKLAGLKLLGRVGPADATKTR